ncbi:DAK2 domain-containing protein [Paenibacillus sp. MWE-103]|uniref:DAK2 domain-containing protein n=1 Tax=Paenibacillus artemisiicola TaxID=1172618 RepID=A0ABS3WJ39_9BACL|nr:DAK2 domain-containing protein [Paenibacillus artemisiicola]MBO7748325.1 DAK2 domain-containing protein [Paenibacillus artemisiicola]
MIKRFINGSDFARMLLSGADNLQRNESRINALNVFPVPDGDTGSNMNLTMSSGKRELQKNPSHAVGKVAEALSKGLLMGARGNSGVILSQLFRGFSKSVANQEQIDAQQFAAALQNGVDMAYKAVVKPVEGTILTVAKDTAKHAVAFAKRNNDVAQLVQEVVSRANESLERTPELLPVLKQVGVVDSGGQGLVCIYEGFLSCLAEENGISGEAAVGAEAAAPMAFPRQEATKAPAQPVPIPVPSASRHASAQSKLETEQIEFLYDMEFFINRKQAGRTGLRFDEALFKGMLSRDGDSILVIVDDEIIKVHVHTRKPGDVLNFALPYGELTEIHILNMREQHRDLLHEEESAAIAGGMSAPGADALPETAVVEEAALGLAVSEVLTGTPADALSAEQAHELAPFGLVAVAMGDGIRAIFLDNNVDVVLSGGQTMNPSTEDFVRAIESLPAEHIFLLPNNSNIILAAQQAAELSGRNVTVIGSKNIPQGLAAVLAFREEEPAEMNAQAMNEAVLQVRSGQVTNAVRNTSIDGISIHEGDYIGILEKTIVTASPSLQETCRELLARMLEDGGELVTVLTGEQAKPAETAELTAWAKETFPDAEFEVHAGGQPLYPYLIAVE